MVRALSTSPSKRSRRPRIAIPASPEGTLDPPERTPIFPSPLEHRPVSRALSELVNEESGPAPPKPAAAPAGTQGGGTAGPPIYPAPCVLLLHQHSWTLDPAQGPGLSSEEGKRGGCGGPGSGCREEGEKDTADSWPEEGAGVRGSRREGAQQSNFPEKQSTCSGSDSKKKKRRVGSSVTTSNAQTKEREDSKSIFQMGLGFSWACLRH